MVMRHDDWVKNVAKGCKQFREEILDNLTQPIVDISSTIWRDG